MVIDKETGEEVRVYNPHGQGSDSRHFGHPSGMAIKGDWLLVADNKNQRIMVSGRDENALAVQLW